MVLPPDSIFISYRRSDSVDVTGRIYDRLTAHYGKASIFKDVDSIPYGSDFREYIRKYIDKCRVLIAIIGPTWLETKDDTGERRIHNPQDWVRVEIESALARNISLIPLLVNNAHLPAAIALPKSLQNMAYRNCAQARPDPDFHQDLDKLIQNLDKILSHRQPTIMADSPYQYSHLLSLKAKSLDSQISTLSEDYKALIAQLNYTENVVTKNNIKRQLALMEKEIVALEMTRSTLSNA